MTRKIEAPEPDEDAGGLNRRHLLRAFWKSAGGFWGRETQVSWTLSGTLLLIVLLNLAASYGMNAEPGFGYSPVAISALLAASSGKRLVERRADLRAHDDAAAMARVAQ